MKKKICICAVLVIIIGAIAGCQNAEKETSNRNTDTEKSGELQEIQQVMDKDEGSRREYQSERTENILNNTTENEEKKHIIEEYGVVEEKQQEFLGEETKEVSYYYKMEEFFINDTVSNASSINRTLQQIYEEHEKKYVETSELYKNGVDEFGEALPNVPYDYWHLLSLSYAGEDYISILYNDIGYMGGAHSYSRFYGITIDCRTGKQVSASELLEKSDEEILTEVSSTMGLDVSGTWEDIDFYLTDETMVFFYREPGFWEDVVWDRNH